MEITLRKVTVQRRTSRSRYRLSELITLWYQRQRQRRALLQLNDRMLSDIGISRCDAEQEATKPFWKA
jgi:uncharacterized protein YjiS (DUF1127 family)